MCAAGGRNGEGGAGADRLGRPIAFGACDRFVCKEQVGAFLKGTRNARVGVGCLADGAGPDVRRRCQELPILQSARILRRPVGDLQRPCPAGGFTGEG